jgi:hypothetical protein
MNGTRPRRGHFILVLVLLLGAVSCPNLTPIAPPDATEPVDLLDKLENQGQIFPIQNPLVLSMIFDLPAGPADSGEISLRRQSGAALPRLGLFIKTTEALESPGLYLAVEDDGFQIVHLVRLSDPRIIRSESVVGGALQPHFEVTEGGVISARVPFAKDGFIKIFEIYHDTSSGQVSAEVSRVLVVAPLGPSPFPWWGRLLEVPYS